MSTPESEQVLTLLKELSVLKELKKESHTGLAGNSQQDAHRVREQEIGKEIQALADDKKRALMNNSDQ